MFHFVSSDKRETRIKEVLYLLLLSFLFLNSFFKSSPTIVMPYYMEKFRLTESVTGLISGFYFFPYSIMQLFAGPLSKKIGSVRLLCYGIMLAAIGSLSFAFASSPFSLLVGRFLLGLGLSPVYVCMIAFQHDSFSAQDYAKAFGIQIMTNNLGAACASAPLKSLLKILGIRNLFLSMTAFLLLICALFIILDNKLSEFGNKVVSQAKETNKDAGIFNQLKQSVHVIFTSNILIAVLFIRTTVNAVISTFQSLWGTEWTAVAFPAAGDSVSLSVTVFSAGIMIGSIFSEFLRSKCTERFLNTVKITAYSILGMFAGLAVRHWQWGFINCLITDLLIGILTGHLCVQLTAVVRDTEENHNATIMGFMNFLSNFCSHGFQWFSGALLGQFSLSGLRKTAFDKTYLILILIFTVSSVIPVSMKAIRESFKKNTAA